MPLTKILRLGLIHVAVAITLVPINSTLNRIMISELGLAATLVAVLVSLPYLFSPIQVWIGAYSDRHPLLGYRRTPYIALGLLLCAGGAALAPTAAFMLAGGAGPSLQGLLVALVAFGAWGMGFNFATVSYLSLATDMAGEEQRARTVGVMWFMLIVSVIVTAILAGRALRPYSVEALYRVFYVTSGTALALGLGGLLGLERRGAAAGTGERQSFGQMLRMIGANRQARLFFVYLILMLAAILGQDILLEPYGAQEFGMTVRQTTQLTATWGAMTLAALLIQGLLLSRWLSKKTGALIGALIATAGLLLIAASGIFDAQALFVPGVAALGFGTGIATSTNLALMLDMTTPEQVGLFIGAWGVADALARGAGMLLGGVVRDVVTAMTGSLSNGYITVFLIEAIMLAGSLLLLRLVDVGAFRSRQPTLTELVALAGDA